MTFATHLPRRNQGLSPHKLHPDAYLTARNPARPIKETFMRTSIIILASIGGLVASSAAFAAAPYANTAAAPAVVKHQLVKKVSSATSAPAAKSIHKMDKKVQKVAMTHKKHRKPAVAPAKDASPVKAM
jgi:hypothetical protein